MLKVLTRQRDKRRFLTMGLAATSGMLSLPLACAARQDCTRWAFLSDTHIHRDPQYRFRSFCTYENLQRVVDDIGEEIPEGLVITGDLARSRGSADAYENFKSLLAPIAKKRPIHLCIGNHDHREDFRTAFTGPAHGGAIENRHIVTAMAGPIRMIVLDTLLVVNTFPGMLGKLQRIWLETYLAASDETPTILFCHHAPRADLLDTRRLFGIISPVRKVKALVFGHSHRYEFSQRDGIHLVNLPATGYNFTAGQPVGWVEARLTGEGGEFTLHAVGGNTSQHGSTQALRWRQ